MTLSIFLCIGALFLLVIMLLYKNLPMHLIYKSKRQLQNIFDAIHDPIAIINQEYIITRVNHAYCRMVSRGFKEILGTKCFTTLRGLESPCVDCIKNSTVGTNKAAIIEQSPHPFKKDNSPITISFFSIEEYAGGTGCVVEHIRETSALEKEKKILVEHNTSLLKTTESLSLSQEKTREELALARQIQLGIMPSAPPIASGIQFASLYHPIEEVGGDIYDFFPYDDGSIGIFIGDVSGHGLASAFVGTIVKMSLYNYCRISQNPSHLLNAINADFLKTIRSGHYLTCFWGIVNPARSSFAFSRGGHPRPIHISKDNKATSLNSAGTILGILETALYEEHEIPLAPGDRIYFFTDGIFEIMSDHTAKERTMLGYEHFKAILVECNKNPFDKVLPALTHALSAFTYEDDYTLVMLEIPLT